MNPEEALEAYIAVQNIVNSTVDVEDIAPNCEFGISMPTGFTKEQRDFVMKALNWEYWHFHGKA